MSKVPNIFCFFHLDQVCVKPYGTTEVLGNAARVVCPLQSFKAVGGLFGLDHNRAEATSLLDFDERLESHGDHAGDAINGSLLQIFLYMCYILQSNSQDF